MFSRRFNIGLLIFLGRGFNNITSPSRTWLLFGQVGMPRGGGVFLGHVGVGARLSITVGLNDLLAHE